MNQHGRSAEEIRIGRQKALALPAVERIFKFAYGGNGVNVMPELSDLIKIYFIHSVVNNFELYNALPNDKSLRSVFNLWRVKFDEIDDSNISYSIAHTLYILKNIKEVLNENDYNLSFSKFGDESNISFEEITSTLDFLISETLKFEKEYNAGSEEERSKGDRYLGKIRFGIKDGSGSSGNSSIAILWVENNDTPVTLNISIDEENEDGEILYFNERIKLEANEKASFEIELDFEYPTGAEYCVDITDVDSQDLIEHCVTAR
jgi:hypothetical protein